ncbi:hypothetical protein H5410_017003 [Solanum commersonii]|uniref:Uncharacterized protein n=1 Tax=Solanum commersonii TaxID=4109 RepID=A0A9J5ZYM9_SOLCO|nr:hypothetical protein H5410_017003 [Solanum commersonii]
MSKKQIETPRKSPIFDEISTDNAHAPSFNILSQTPRLKLFKFRSPNKKDKNNEANQSATTANQRGKKRKRKKLVETPPEFDSDLDSNFIGQTKKKKTKKATKVEVAETSKPYTRRKTKKDEPELPKSKNPKKVVKISTILWHYGKTKNEDGAINKSEVIGTVASKFGGPRIAKEHVSDTTNYPTPIPPTRNLVSNEIQQKCQTGQVYEVSKRNT